MGELNLTGQIRSIPFLDLRLKEVDKMGYKRVVIPGSTYRNRAYSTDLEVLEVNTIEQFIDLIMEG